MLHVVVIDIVDEQSVIVDFSLSVRRNWEPRFSFHRTRFKTYLPL